MRLFNYTSQKHDPSFILNGKEWGEGKLQRERETERTDRVWEAECSRERVVAWKINLTIGTVFMRVQSRDNPRVYQDGNKAYPKNF
jgi:hypothetical protein